MWTVIGKSEHQTTRRASWKCRCECGIIKTVIGDTLRRRKSTSCGHGKSQDLTGKRFGQWTILNRSGNLKSGSAKWMARCDCGKIKIIPGVALNAGQTSKCKSCAGKQVSEQKRLNQSVFIHNSGQARGENNPSAKLNEAKVALIKAHISVGVGLSLLALYFSVNRETIRRIASNFIWGHVKAADTKDLPTASEMRAEIARRQAELSGIPPKDLRKIRLRDHRLEDRLNALV